MWKRKNDHEIWLAEREQDAPSSSAAAGEDPPQTGEGVDGQGQEPLSGKKQPPPRSGEAAQELGMAGEMEDDTRQGEWSQQQLNITFDASELSEPTSYAEAMQSPYSANWS
ncbi:unnamed protein product, partial [Laminaria digitata]